MSISQKLTLENALFARAAALDVPLYARAGRLFCAAPEPLLRHWTRLYNACFASCNQRLLAEEAAHSRAFYAQEARAFEVDRKINPPWPAARLRRLKQKMVDNYKINML